MDAADLADAVREETKTELSRLGSSKSLYADTRGEMTEDAVLAAAADTFGAAADTLESWADDEGDATAADCFADAAATARDHHETVLDERGDRGDAGTPPLYEHLAGLDGTAERLGGLLGHAVVLDKKVDQLTGFFVGQASPQTSQVFRAMGEDVEATETAALDAVATLDDDAVDAAFDAAVAAVEVAYDAYFETLEDLGVNPKPVC